MASVVSDVLNHQTTRLFSGYNQQTSLPIFTNLSEEERKEGFPSAEFSPEQVSRLAADLGTTLATINGELLGFRCAFGNDFDHGSLVIAKMLDTYDLVTFDGHPLRIL